jgi:uncharacterized membrane protein YdjX (TVP38/TMEM64 family)
VTWAALGEQISTVLSSTTEDVHQFVAAWGAWAALGSIILMAVHSVLPLPGGVIAVANRMMFGPFWGSVTTWVGAIIGATTSFGLARFLGAPAVERLLSGEQRSVIARWRSRPLLLLLIRLIPVISFNLINYAAGAAGVRWWLFLWTTALGILPITIVSVVAGDRLLDATWQEWTIAGVAVLVLGIGVHWGRRKLLDREESS